MPYRKLRNALIVTLCGWSLTACSHTSNPSRITYPSDMFICKDAPDAAKVGTDNDLSVFVAELFGAHEDCKSKLNKAGEVVNGPDK